MARRRIIGRRLSNRADQLQAKANDTMDVAQQVMLGVEAGILRGVSEALSSFDELKEEIEDGFSFTIEVFGMKVPFKVGVELEEDDEIPDLES